MSDQVDPGLEDERERKAEAEQEAREDEYYKAHPPSLEEPDPIDQDQRADELRASLLPLVQRNGSTLELLEHLNYSAQAVALTLARQLALQGFGIACRECSNLHRALAELVYLVGQVKPGQLRGNKNLSGAELLTRMIDALNNAKKTPGLPAPKDLNLQRQPSAAQRTPAPQGNRREPDDETGNRNRDRLGACPYERTRRSGSKPRR